MAVSLFPEALVAIITQHALKTKDNEQHTDDSPSLCDSPFSAEKTNRKKKINGNDSNIALTQ